MISLRRFKEFLRVAFGPRVTFRNYIDILKASVKVLKSPYREEIWRSRMYTCYRCPVFDKSRKICRPYKGSVLGCGCYAPYKALVKDRCWGRQNMGEHFGW